VDFARFRFSWGVRYALFVDPGYSPVLRVQIYPRQDMRSLLLGLKEAFAYSGAVPQDLLFYHMKSTIRRTCGSRRSAGPPAGCPALQPAAVGDAA